jgi:predicted nuclease of predicted toxin-antitoxin system
VRVLFDQGTPAPLRHALTGHSVETAFELGWGTLQNGALIAEAESNGFDVLLTTDKNLKYQQNLSGRRIAIVVLSTTSCPRIRVGATKVMEAVASAVAGSYAEVAVD